MVIKNFEGYEIRSVHEQKYASRWGTLKDNQYRIFIKNLATGIECSFPYWNGTMIYRPMKESRELDYGTGTTRTLSTLIRLNADLCGNAV